MQDKNDDRNETNVPSVASAEPGKGRGVSQQGPAVRFVIVFVGLVTLFYVPYAYVSQTDGYKSTYLSLVARSAGGVLGILGQKTEVVGTFIRTLETKDSPLTRARPGMPLRKLPPRKGAGMPTLAERIEMKRVATQDVVESPPPDLAFEIVPGCDGTEGFALLGSAVLASPFLLRARLVFLLIGTAVLFVVNILRIVTLFILGLYFPSVLHTAHMDLWPGFIIVAVLVCWLTWARWMMRRQAGIPRERG